MAKYELFQNSPLEYDVDFHQQFVESSDRKTFTLKSPSTREKVAEGKLIMIITDDTAPLLHTAFP